MSNRPANWYSMGWEERQSWERQERERSDLEYQRDQAREEMERSDRERKHLEEDYRNELASEQEQRQKLAGELGNARQLAQLRLAFIRERGLYADYERWVSDRLPLPTDPIIDDDDNVEG